jgi:quinol monooxygenase YgiN
MNLTTLAASPDCQKILAGTINRPTISTIILLAASAATAACSSSSTGSGGAGGSTSTTSVTSSSSSKAATSSTSSSVSTATGAGTGAGGGAPVPAAAFFRGPLAASVAESKANSDPFFLGVKAQAQAAGDIGHDALLGTTHLGTTLDQFVGLDRWSSDANMDAVYANPQVQAFGASFYASPPEFKTFFLTNFYQWGDLDAADAVTPHYFVVVRGRFKDIPENIKAIHDPIAQGAEAQSKMEGDVAHIVYSGRQDPQDALIVDLWSTDTNIDAFYSNPQFKTDVDSLFDATGPNFGVYSSTDWVTW